MITREKLAEQLKVYQSRSQHKWNSTLIIFSPKPQLYTRTDLTVARVVALLFGVLVIFIFVAFYFRHFWLSLILICFGILLPVCLKISRRRKLAIKRERRMLLPLSM
ncbi:Nadh-ubiquinone oxidoreductase chain [Thalictrum thalictroides]|uniref:Nadh-ubiquinone oxidoreductase chain n=1 Tax=Thalictrum thalictroides TaxID=46969 RepID=A0A7J6WN30_THATH|nr:Nadh-ubiquinone oxidoreductase chain [Thalictrum thalictroides]